MLLEDDGRLTSLYSDAVWQLVEQIPLSNTGEDQSLTSRSSSSIFLIFIYVSTDSLFNSAGS